MSRRWKKSVSLIVLVSFVALLLPKSLWHDCSHRQHTASEHSNKTSKHAIEQGVEKCYACDLHIPLLSNPVEGTQAVVHAFVADQISTRPVTAVFGIVEIQTLRGPPAGMS
jgi:hypothetical protein